MEIENPGPRLVDQDIDRVEALLGSKFPLSYRRFLLHHNGGAPTPDLVDVPGAQWSPTDVQVFFGIGRTLESSNLPWNLPLASRHTDKRLLPFASDSGGNLFCFVIEGGIAGEVVYCDLGEGDSIYPVAPGFNEFLDRLRDLEQPTA